MNQRICQTKSPARAAVLAGAVFLCIASAATAQTAAEKTSETSVSGSTVVQPDAVGKDATGAPVEVSASTTEGDTIEVPAEATASESEAPQDVKLSTATDVTPVPAASKSPAETQNPAGNPNADGKLATPSASSVIESDAIAPKPKADNFIAKGIPRTDRIVNVLTTQTVRPGAMTLTIDHRAHDTFLSGEDAWFDYLGLDSGNLKIGIGLRLGLKDYMDLGFYRLNNGADLFDVYEFDTKLRFFEQDDAFINMSLRIGATWFVQKDANDASGFFSQVNIDRRLFGVLLLGTGFAFHTDSTNEDKLLEDQDPSAAILGYAEWRPVRKFSLNGEIAATVAGYHSKFPIFSLSARFLTHRHSFSVVVANTQHMSADGIVANSPKGFGHLLFGFQIVREFNLLD